MVSLFSSQSVRAGDNEIKIEQLSSDGDNLVLLIDQIGHDNTVDFTIDHASNEIEIKQTGQNNIISYVSYWGSGKNWGGDLDGSGNDLYFEQLNTLGSETNRIGFHIPGDNNTLKIGQGCTFNSMADVSCGDNSSSEYGGHTSNIDIHSDNVTIKGGQQTGSGSAEHDAKAYFYGADNSSFFYRQMGNGDKTLTYVTYQDNSEGTVHQRGDGDHTATITLTGSQPTTLNLNQNSSTNQTYSLSQNCQTSGGCSVTVTQN